MGSNLRWGQEQGHVPAQGLGRRAAQSLPANGCSSRLKAATCQEIQVLNNAQNTLPENSPLWHAAAPGCISGTVHAPALPRRAVGAMGAGT